MKVLETLRTEFEEELATKDARILEVPTFQLDTKYKFKYKYKYKYKYKLQVVTFQLHMKYEF